MLCVVAPPGLHTLPVALLLVSVMLLPAQKLLGPLIVGVDGSGTTVIEVLAVASGHPPEAAIVYVTVYVPVALVARSTSPVPGSMLSPAGAAL